MTISFLKLCPRKLVTNFLTGQWFQKSIKTPITLLPQQTVFSKLKGNYFMNTAMVEISA